MSIILGVKTMENYGLLKGITWLNNNGFTIKLFISTYGQNTLESFGKKFYLRANAGQMIMEAASGLSKY